MKKFIILTIAMIMATFSMSQANILEDLNEKVNTFEKEIKEIDIIVNELNNVKTQKAKRINIQSTLNWLFLNKKMDYTRKHTLKKIKLLITQCKKITNKEWLMDKENIRKQLETTRKLNAILKNYQAVIDWMLEIKTKEVPEPRRARSN